MQPTTTTCISPSPSPEPAAARDAPSLRERCKTQLDHSSATILRETSVFGLGRLHVKTANAGKFSEGGEVQVSQAVLDALVDASQALNQCQEDEDYYHGAPLGHVPRPRPQPWGHFANLDKLVVKRQAGGDGDEAQGMSGRLAAHSSWMASTTATGNKRFGHTQHRFGPPSMTKPAAPSEIECKSPVLSLDNELRDGGDSGSGDEAALHHSGLEQYSRSNSSASAGGTRGSDGTAGNCIAGGTIGGGLGAAAAGKPDPRWSAGRAASDLAPQQYDGLPSTAPSLPADSAAWSSMLSNWKADLDVHIYHTRSAKEDPAASVPDTGPTWVGGRPGVLTPRSRGSLGQLQGMAAAQDWNLLATSPAAGCASDCGSGPGPGSPYAGAQALSATTSFGSRTGAGPGSGSGCVVGSSSSSSFGPGPGSGSTSLRGKASAAINCPSAAFNHTTRSSTATSSAMTAPQLSLPGDAGFGSSLSSPTGYRAQKHYHEYNLSFGSPEGPGFVAQRSRSTNLGSSPAGSSKAAPAPVPAPAPVLSSRLSVRPACCHSGCSDAECLGDQTCPLCPGAGAGCPCDLVFSRFGWTSKSEMLQREAQPADSWRRRWVFRAHGHLAAHRAGEPQLSLDVLPELSATPPRSTLDTQQQAASKEPGDEFDGARPEPASGVHPITLPRAVSIESAKALGAHPPSLGLIALTAQGIQDIRQMASFSNLRSRLHQHLPPSSLLQPAPSAAEEETTEFCWALGDAPEAVPELPGLRGHRLGSRAYPSMPGSLRHGQGKVRAGNLDGLSRVLELRAPRRSLDLRVKAPNLEVEGSGAPGRDRSLSSCPCSPQASPVKPPPPPPTAAVTPHSPRPPSTLEVRGDAPAAEAARRSPGAAASSRVPMPPHRRSGCIAVGSADLFASALYQPTLPSSPVRCAPRLHGRLTDQTAHPGSPQHSGSSLTASQDGAADTVTFSSWSQADTSP